MLRSFFTLRWVLPLALLFSLSLFGVLASMVGMRLARAQVAAHIYQERLEDLSAQYQTLRSQYNEAVKRTAVTELIVEEGELSVRVRTAEGIERTIETDFDPAGEIYVDYVVLNGRLWIRRLFDAKTAPWRGLVIDPMLEGINWDDPRFAVGKAVYRSLDEGRWIVSVTGAGALGLARASADEETPLAAVPDIRDYHEVQREITTAVEEIDFLDFWRTFTSSP